MFSDYEKRFKEEAAGPEAVAGPEDRRPFLTSEDYEKVFDEAAETIFAVSDLEGGDLILSTMYELLESLVETGSAIGAQIVIQKLRDIAMGDDDGESADYMAPIWLDVMRNVLQDWSCRPGDA